MSTHKIYPEEPLISSESFNKLRDDFLNEENLFKSLFLYGYPTETLLKILLALYQENVIRIISQKQNTNIKEILKYMTGFLELDDGTLYFTISEDPNETQYFWEKISELKCILEYLGAEIIIDASEKSIEDKIKSSDNLKNLLNSCNISKINSKAHLYRTGGVGANKIPIDQFKKIKKHVVSNSDKNDIHPMFLLTGMKIHLVNSSKYLLIRKTGYSYRPLKRSKKKIVACNNGSTCVESKLFYYINMHHKNPKVKGFVAYWVGNDLPPNHTIKGYCYDLNKHDQKKNFDTVTLLSKNLLKKHQKQLFPSTLDLSTRSRNNLVTGESSAVNSKTNLSNTATSLQSKMINNIDDIIPDEILKNALIPLALPCPGCLFNWNSYKSNHLIHWDISECKKPRKGLDIDTMDTASEHYFTTGYNLVTAEVEDLLQIKEMEEPILKRSLSAPPDIDLSYLDDESISIARGKRGKKKSKNIKKNQKNQKNQKSQKKSKKLKKIKKSRKKHFLGKSKKSRKK